MLHALDARTGALLWSVDLDSHAAAAPALADGRLFVPTQGGRLVVVSARGCGAATCSPLWSASSGGWMFQQPVVAGGVVFTSSFDSLNGFIRAFDAAGCGSPTCPPLWQGWVDGEITTTAVSDGRLFVGTAHQQVIAFG
jgi:outer membrane protein assembly factor BamB